MHLDPAVIYIGKSTNLRARLRRHNKVFRGSKCYTAVYRDLRLENLYAAAYVCDSAFKVRTKTDANKLLHALENRKLQEYVALWGKLPVMNLWVGRPKTPASDAVSSSHVSDLLESEVSKCLLERIARRGQKKKAAALARHSLHFFLATASRVPKTDALSN